MNLTPSRLLLLVAVIIFVLAVFSVALGPIAGVEMVALGLAFFAAAGLV